MTEPSRAEANVRRAIVSTVLVRACWVCQHPRDIGKDCEGCGLTDPPVVHDLGVQSATFRNPAKRAWWSVVGQPLANRRARRAARYTPPVS